MARAGARRRAATGDARTVVAVYISSHGFGHAARAVALVNALGSRRPGLRIVVRTRVPGWLLEAGLRTAATVAPADTDTGLVQIDGLRLDEEASAHTAAAFYGEFDRRADAEAAWLARTGVRGVVADIPPLAFAAAARAGLPAVAVANFTWDWIYSAYPAFGRLAPGVIETIRAAYGHAAAALRLPMHGGFEPMAAVTRDIPFIARRATVDRGEARRRLGLDDSRPVVLASFGAYGAAFAREGLSGEPLALIDGGRGLPAGLRYPDLVAAADVVVSKPGYGIVSDCLANDVALLYTSRGRFPEYDVMVAEMPRVLRCRYLDPSDFAAGRWGPAVRALLAQPAPPDRARLDGAEVAAGEIETLVAG